MPENKFNHLPLLIARALVLFPSLSEEIEVGRPFSIAAVEDARKRTNSLVLLVSQKEESTEEPTEENLFSVGTLARIVSA